MIREKETILRQNIAVSDLFFIFCFFLRILSIARTAPLLTASGLNNPYIYRITRLQNNDTK